MHSPWQNSPVFWARFCLYTCNKVKLQNIRVLCLPLKNVAIHTLTHQMQTHLPTLYLQNWGFDTLIDKRVAKHFSAAHFGKKKKSPAKYTHTYTLGSMPRERLIPSVVSYCMSVVMCLNYWSDKRTRHPKLVWNKKEINSYYTHWTTHKNTYRYPHFLH